jgi:hypothetical protein
MSYVDVIGTFARPLETKVRLSIGERRAMTTAAHSFGSEAGSSTREARLFAVFAHSLGSDGPLSIGRGWSIAGEACSLDGQRKEPGIHARSSGSERQVSRKELRDPASERRLLSTEAWNTKRIGRPSKALSSRERFMR